MFEHHQDFFGAPDRSDHGSPRNRYTYQYNTALTRFKSALLHGRFSRLKCRLMHRSPWLHDLTLIKPGLCLRGSFYSGIQVVRISSVVGTEGKAHDFDMNFHPIHEESRERWVNMAMAYLNCLPLPPIQLIQIGDAYFVRDGHHRISVSRAFGQISMDAEVITWQAAPPFPWQASTAQQEAFTLKKLDSSI